MQESTADASGAEERRVRLRTQIANLGALLWFNSRLTLGVQALVLILLAAGAFVYAALGQKVATDASVFLLLLELECVFFVVLSMGLIPREKEGKTLEVLLVCVQSRQGLLFLKFAPVCIFIALVSLVLTTGFHWLTGGFPYLRMLGVPYLLAATLGILTIALSTYLRNQYAAGIAAVLLAIVVAVLWLDPVRTFYVVESHRTLLEQPPNLLLNRTLVGVAFGFLYDHTVRRLEHVELWMREKQ